MSFITITLDLHLTSKQKEAVLSILEGVNCISLKAYKYFQELYQSKKELRFDGIKQFAEGNDTIKKADSNSLMYIVTNTLKAFKSYIKGNSKYPKLKTDIDHYIIYNVMTKKGGGIRFENDMLRLPKLGLIQYSGYRKLPENYTIKHAMVYNQSGKNFVKLLLEIPDDAAKLINNQIDNLMNILYSKNEDKIVVLNFSPTNLYTASDSSTGGMEYFIREVNDKYKSIKEELDKHEPNSKEYNKILEEFERFKEETLNKRKNTHQQLIDKLLDKYDFIIIPSMINIEKIMQQQPKDIRQFVYRVDWTNFIQSLQNAGKRLGKTVYELQLVDPLNKYNYTEPCFENISILINTRKVAFEKINDIVTELNYELEYIDTTSSENKNKKDNACKIDSSKAIGLIFNRNTTNSIYVASESNKKIEKDIANFIWDIIRKLKGIHKKMDKLEKGTKAWYIAKANAEKFYTKFENQKKHNMHNISNFLIENYDIIAVSENSDFMKNVTYLYQNEKDSLVYEAWKTLLYFLEYKSKKNGKTFIKIPWESQLRCVCSNCKNYQNDVDFLPDETYFCHKCHIGINKDFNEAINIRDKALKIVENERFEEKE